MIKRCSCACCGEDKSRALMHVDRGLVMRRCDGYRPPTMGLSRRGDARSSMAYFRVIIIIREGGR